jgi:hypothetical protein
MLVCKDNSRKGQMTEREKLDKAAELLAAAAHYLTESESRKARRLVRTIDRIGVSVCREMVKKPVRTAAGKGDPC